jgi:phosphoribosylaminoimidazole carboxylase PurE protein
MGKILVAIMMGSQSDLPTMQEAANILKEFGVSYEIKVLSAHRTPKECAAYAEDLRSRGVKVVIAGAGGSAALAGVVAAHTTLPVIGIPIESTALNGLDSLLSTVQMPPGVPVGAVAIGKPGGKNAGLLALRILSLSDKVVEKKLVEYQISQAEKILKIRLDH